LSEKTEAGFGQLSLFGEAEAAPPPEPETEEITYRRKKQKGKREADLSNLPVERVEHELGESERICPECGETMRDIGVDVRREMKLVPAKIVVVEHAAHTYACRNCEKTGISVPFAKAPAPAALIPGSLASPSLVAHVAAQKYVNGTPLYRIEKGFSYDGVVMGRKSWLFSNTPAGAAASSVMYSIMETAKENGLHPFRYMEFLLETLPNAKTSDLESLLPWSDSLPERCRV
jgi:transposase